MAQALRLPLYCFLTCHLFTQFNQLKVRKPITKIFRNSLSVMHMTSLHCHTNIYKSGRFPRKKTHLILFGPQNQSVLLPVFSFFPRKRGRRSRDRIRTLRRRRDRSKHGFGSSSWPKKSPEINFTARFLFECGVCLLWKSGSREYNSKGENQKID